MVNTQSCKMIPLNTSVNLDFNRFFQNSCVIDWTTIKILTFFSSYSWSCFQIAGIIIDYCCGHPIVFFDVSKKN